MTVAEIEQGIQSAIQQADRIPRYNYERMLNAMDRENAAATAKYEKEIAAQTAR